MPSAHAEQSGPVAVPTGVKILVAGGFGAGKTTLVGSVSEIRPLQTEEVLSPGEGGSGGAAHVPGKATTTVAMDFGRITISDSIVLYLFGTPGQDRFWFLWDELAHGAVGAVVLADTRRLPECFPSVDYFEKRGMPFVVGVNCFDGGQAHRPDEIREALNLSLEVPLLLCDARERQSSKEILIALVEHAMAVEAARVPRSAGRTVRARRATQPADR